MPKRQSGAATLLILALMGISITVAVLSSVDMIRGTQSQTTTYHSQVQAQMNAWSGVSAMYEYVKGLQQSDTPPSSEELYTSFETAHEQGNNIFSGTSGLEAYVTKLEGDGEQFNLTVSIHGVSMPGSDRVRAVSIIDVVSRFTKGDDTPASDASPPPVMNFVGDLSIGGNMEVISESDTPTEISVDGFIESGNSSIRGLDIINATESIDFGGGSEFKVLRTNGDVRFNGSVTVLEEIQARGNVCISGGSGSLGLTKANGFVYGDGGANFGSIQAKGEVINDSYMRLCESDREVDGKGNLLVVNLAGNHDLDSVQSLGTVRNRGGSIASLLAEGDLLNGYGSVDSGTITGAAFYCNGNKVKNCKDLPRWKNDVNVTTDPNLSVSISDVKEVKVDLPIFDANEFREFANYAFDINPDGFPVVTVKHVQNIPDGQYFLGSYDGPYKDRLCTSLTGDSSPSNPMCATPTAEASYPICEGYSRWNRCFSYDAGISNWSISGNSLAQGIAWFNGNLSISGGTYYNSFVATQNIVTGSNTTLYAPNYAGYAGNAEAPNGICQNAVSQNIPTQLCQGGSYNPDWAQGIGNYSLLAGSVLDNEDYLGGNIQLGAKTESYGSVLAGNEFGTSGNSTIYGYVSAYAAGESTDHSIGGSTTIVLDALPPTYTPQGPLEVPSVGEDLEEPFGFELLWTRPG
jgi:hypothetical protein